MTDIPPAAGLRYDSTYPPGARIGFFGGSFNPPHVAHLIVAEMVREQFSLDEILWVPNRQSPFKEAADLASPEDRLEMTRRTVALHEAFRVSDLELRRPGPSYTNDSIRSLQESSPGATFFLIIGSDSLAGFGGWRSPDEIVRRAPLIVYPRPGYEDEKGAPEFRSRMQFADAPLLDISGTVIRQRLQERRTVRFLVPEQVHEFILERGLYRK